MSERPAVTFDVFSALIDSRSGGAAAFARLCRLRGWADDPEGLYADWDARNKSLHAQDRPFAPFRTLAREAMAALCADRRLAGAPDADTDFLLATVGAWPHYPDVPDGLAAVARHHRVALLSNIDDDLLDCVRLGFDVGLRITSQQARAYKPHAALYDHARQRLGSYVHVPASARDVRGSLEAGIPVIRVARPGHAVDPSGPQPSVVVGDLSEVAEVLAARPRS